MMELETVRLQRSGDRWWFQTEADLEEFLWLRGEAIFGWRWLARQLAIDGQFCDLLAVDRDGALVVVELKNEEEKYIVQQLTRYFHALIEVRPFADVVDYSLPIRLLAIAPSFHRHSLTDRLYSILKINFFQYQILEEKTNFQYEICDLDSVSHWKGSLAISESSSQFEIPEPPRKLLTYLKKTNLIQRERILDIRRKILSFDSRMKEINLSNCIQYGKNKSLVCAELKMNNDNVCLFLWLPHISQHKLCRMWISQDLEWQNINSFHYCSSGFKSSEFYTHRSPKDMLDFYLSLTCDDDYIYQHYAKAINNPEHANSLDTWLEIALDEWLARVNKR